MFGNGSPLEGASENLDGTNIWGLFPEYVCFVISQNMAGFRQNDSHGF